MGNTAASEGKRAGPRERGGALGVWLVLKTGLRECGPQAGPLILVRIDNNSQ